MVKNYFGAKDSALGTRPKIKKFRVFNSIHYFSFDQSYTAKMLKKSLRTLMKELIA